MPSTLAPPSTPAALSLRRRHVAVPALALGVALLHLWLLSDLAWPGAGGKAPPPRVLQVRQIVQPAAAPALAAAPAPPARRAPTRAAEGPPTEAPAVGDAGTPSEPPAAATDTEPPGGTPVPVYATRLPPAATLQYTVMREGGLRSGLQAELRWRPADDGRYTLTMGLAATGWASVGAVDDHGLAPERQVETRRGREVRAANFQRDAGRITFSGPQIEYPLLPGAQDRISWLLQLAAVLEAAPELAGRGREVVLFVAGPRGDGRPWTFVSQGAESVELAGGAVEGVRLHREPAGPFDTRVDVWLDPARHHLPVRLRLQNRAEGEVTEFALQALTQP
ncbi:MAG: DUF3108 domain-containing protein [Rubrivivax sp.]|nr:DUF3108 domain-containing protein [Rubrivivax sp.]